MLCKAENFRLGRDADPAFCATGDRRSAGNDDVSHRLAPDALTARRMRATARRRAGLVAAI